MRPVWLSESPLGTAVLGLSPTTSFFMGIRALWFEVSVTISCIEGYEVFHATMLLALEIWCSYFTHRLILPSFHSLSSFHPLAFARYAVPLCFLFQVLELLILSWIW